MSISEPLIGIWDLYAGPAHSELVLKPDGSYSHAFWGGNQGHWGKWSLENMDNHAVLVMRLEGAQPMVFYGPYGPQPMQWPAAEQWAIQSVQSNQVNLFGAIMVRRFPLAVPQQPVQQQQSQPAVQPPQPAQPPPPDQGHASRAAMSVASYLNATAAGQQGVAAAPAPQTPLECPAGWDISSLGSHTEPPLQIPPPAAHNPQILNQWQNILTNLQQQPVNPGMFTQQQPAMTPEMWTAQNQTAMDAFKMQQESNINWRTAQQEMALKQEKARHAIAVKYIDYAGS